MCCVHLGRVPEEELLHEKISKSVGCALLQVCTEETAAVKWMLLQVRKTTHAALISFLQDNFISLGMIVACYVYHRISFTWPVTDILNMTNCVVKSRIIFCQLWKTSTVAVWGQACSHVSCLGDRQWCGVSLIGNKAAGSKCNHSLHGWLNRAAHTGQRAPKEAQGGMQRWTKLTRAHWECRWPWRWLRICLWTKCQIDRLEETGWRHRQSHSWRCH